MKENSCVLDVFETINQFQNDYYKFMSSFLNPLKQRANDGTIPIMLFLKDGSLVEGTGVNIDEEYFDCFKTYFFRIEKIDPLTNCAIVTLLRPVGMDREAIQKVSDLYRLERTFLCMEIELDCVCAVQCVSPKLINRTLPIKEPKW